jgi:hypothetical protein
MSRINTKPPKTAAPRTHEGAVAARISSYQTLRRSVASCLLWEDAFYEDGQAIAGRISALAQECPTDKLKALALEARSQFNLRHVPLVLLLELIRRGGAGTAEAIAATIQRPDEITELLALYWKDGKRPLSKQLKLGLSLAFNKFNEYSLAKYNQDNAVKLRDALFLSRAKPKNEEQAGIFKRLADGELKTPDTWEVALSGGADKKETFERLLREGKLGYFALLRNLRNMAQAGVDRELVQDALIARKNGAERILPFRYIAAARAAPQFEPAIDKALVAAINELPRLSGTTAVVVDVSGSMDWALSNKSDLKRIDAAAALGAIFPGDVRLFSFSDRLVEVPARKGMAGVEAIISSQSHNGTALRAALNDLYRKGRFDRIIVITDEQSSDGVVAPPDGAKGYMINVAAYQNGVGYGKWTHIDGFSESVLRFIAEYEGAGLDQVARTVESV